jgi:hypothetical protein
MLTLKIDIAASIEGHGKYMKYARFPWLSMVAAVSNFRTVRINGTNIHILTNIAILSSKNEDCSQVNDRIVKTLIAVDSSVDSVGYEAQSGEQRHPMEFLNSLLPPELPSL